VSVDQQPDSREGDTPLSRNATSALMKWLLLPCLLAASSAWADEPAPDTAPPPAEAAATVPPGPATAPDNASPSPAKRTKNDPPPPPALQQPSTPRLPAWGGRGASRGGLLVGLSHSFGLGTSNLDDFWYPSFGWSYDWNRVHIDALTPLPWGFLDMTAGLVRMIASGDDLVLPIWDALNGDGEPARLEAMTVRGRYAFLATSKHKLDAGLLLDLWAVSPWVHDRHLGLFDFDLGPSLGYGLHTDRFSLNLAIDAGNGFNTLSSWNPFFGAELLARLRLGSVVGLYLKVLARSQRFDFTSYTPSNPLLDPAPYHFVRWERLAAVDFGLSFYILGKR